MKTNLRTTLAFFALAGTCILFSSLLTAQSKELSVEKQVSILKVKLKLDHDQTAKITRILEDQREEKTNILHENKDDQAALRAALQELRTKTNDQIKMVLTDEQSEKYNQLMAKRQREDRLRKKREEGY